MTKEKNPSVSKETSEDWLEIIDAVLRCAREMGPLPKLDKNQYAKYSYVSIDDFYRHIARQCIESGLSWRIRETNAERYDDVIHFTYVFDIYMSGGFMANNWDTVNVFHDFRGAQTTGSASSYAEKVFMRRLFKIATGEPDSEYFDKEVITDADQVNPNRQTDTGWQSALDDDERRHMESIRHEAPKTGDGKIGPADASGPDPLEHMRDENGEVSPLPDDPIDDVGLDARIAPDPGTTEAILEAIVKDRSDYGLPVFDLDGSRKYPDVVSSAIISLCGGLMDIKALRALYNDNIGVIDDLPRTQQDAVKSAFNDRRRTLAELARQEAEG